MSFVAAMILGIDSYGAVPGAAVEPRYLDGAEALLAVGRTAESARMYAEAMEAAETWLEKLALAGPFSRAAWVDGSWVEATETLSIPEDWPAWQHAAILSAVLQVPGDTETSRKLLKEAAGDAISAMLVRPMLLKWAEDAGDLAGVARLRREAYQAGPASDDNRRAYAEALLDKGAAEEFRNLLGERADAFRGEADFWRQRLPRLREAGVLDDFARAVETDWDRAEEDWAKLFALAELRLYQEEKDEAIDHFARVAAMPEPPSGAADGRELFRRLNLAFHNRLAAKFRIGGALGSYGSDQHRDFGFLGMRQDPGPSTVGEARDAALQYWKELADWRNGEVVVTEVRMLTREFRPALRMHALAVLNAPRALLEEIGEFLDAGVPDPEAADYALTAINRYVLSTERFPELIEAMSRAADRVEEVFPGDLPERQRRMRDQIQRRLGTFEADESSLPEEGSREHAARQLMAAVESGDPEAAESWHERLVSEHGAFPGSRLLVARAWLSAEDGAEQAARWVAGFLEEFQQPVEAGARPVSAPWRWREAMPFPPPNPFLTFDRMEELQEAVDPAGPVMDAVIAWQTEGEGALPEDRRAGGYFTRALLLAWNDRWEEAAEHLAAGARETGDGNLHVAAAYAMGARERYAEARRLLAELPDPVPERLREEARKLGFALAVYRRDAELAAALAAEWNPETASPRALLELAAGLAGTGLPEEAAAWIDRIAPLALDEGEKAEWRDVRARVALSRGESEEAAALARVTLLKTPPLYFEDLGGEARKSALDVLIKTNSLDEYKAGLETILEKAPGGRAPRLLLGEAHDFLWQAAAGSGAVVEAGYHRREALRHHREAAAMFKGDGEMYFQFIRWLAGRGLAEEAAAAFDHLITVDVVSALLDYPLIFGVYQEAGRMEDLLRFFEKWKSPDADSLDHFYGVQPTEHLLNPLGRRFMELERPDLAARAWRLGLRNNPVEFTEEMRVSYVETALALGQAEEAQEAVVDYGAERMPDLVYFHYQPFSTSVPRWIGACFGRGDPARVPLNRMLGVLAEHGLEEELANRAEKRAAAMADHPSPALFALWAAGRENPVDSPAWDALRKRFPPSERGPMSLIWEAAELFFNECSPN